MNAPPASPEHRTPEQHDAVRRRSFLFAVCGMLCGLAGLAMLLARTIDVARPPTVFAVNLSFCAMMMGIGILFYARGTPGTARSIAACLIAIATGFAGPLVYAKQSLDWHVLVEKRELSNAESIAAAALHYAQTHAGDYPPDLVALLQTNAINLDNLRSPFGTMQSPADAYRLQVELHLLTTFNHLQIAGQNFPSYREPLFTRFAQEIDALSDYQYFGADLQLPETNPKAPNHFGSLPEEIIIATSRNAIMTKQITVAFATGPAIFLDLGGAESALLKSNDARVSLGFSAIRPPEAIRRAQDVERRDPSQK